MLGENYPSLLGRLMNHLSEDIVLPAGQAYFFAETGPHKSHVNDARHALRTRVRTRGLLMLESWYPSMNRLPVLQTIYTVDFSKTGFGFLAAEQFYPGEVVQVFLATFWMRITVRRCRRWGAHCYNGGGTLLDRHDPNDEARLLLAAAALQPQSV